MYALFLEKLSTASLKIKMKMAWAIPVIDEAVVKSTVPGWHRIKLQLVTIDDESPMVGVIPASLLVVVSE